MADLNFYKLSMTGEEAENGIRTGMEAGAASGVLLGDGHGGIRAATPGVDFGYPLLKGNGPPTANTAANIGQHYFDMAATKAPYEYICVGLNSNGFIWIVFGDTGNGFKISGYFSSVAALNAAIEEGKIEAPVAGVSYGIGTEPPYDIVTWDGVANDWKNNGPLGASGGGSGVPPHGTTGQVLKKFSDADYDAGWGSACSELELTLPAANWTDNQQTVDAAGVTADNKVVASAAPVSFDAYGEYGIRCTGQGENSLTFLCTSPPDINIVVNVFIFA